MPIAMNLKKVGIAGTLLLSLAGCKPAATPLQPPTVDAGLVVTGAVPLLKLRAKGVQIYNCKAAEGASTYTFDAAHAEPDAALADVDGQWTVHHYLNLDPGGPAWEAKDGSKVVGKKLDPAQPRPGTIPWLKLQVVAHEGDGPLLKNVTFIQRVDTEGGAAPAGECDPAKTPRVRVPYQATYYFYGPEPN